MNRQEKKKLYFEVIQITESDIHILSAKKQVAFNLKRQLEIELFPLVETIDPLKFKESDFVAKYQEFFLYYGMLESVGSQHEAAKYFDLDQSAFISKLYDLSREVFDFSAGINLPISANYSFRGEKGKIANWIPLYIQLRSGLCNEVEVAKDLQYYEDLEEEGLNAANWLYNLEYSGQPKTNDYWEIESDFEKIKKEMNRLESKYGLDIAT